MRTISHATYVMQRVRIYCSRGRLCQGTFTLMPGDGYKMVLCPHSGYAIVFVHFAPSADAIFAKGA